MTLAGCRQPAPAAPATPGAVGAADGADGKAAQIERGRQLVAIGGRNDCHTPLEFDPEIDIPPARLLTWQTEVLLPAWSAPEIAAAAARVPSPT